MDIFLLIVIKISSSLFLIEHIVNPLCDVHGLNAVAYIST